MTAAAIVDFEIAKFYWLFGWRGSRRISLSNFVKIGQSVAKILRFFRFFKMAATAMLDCWICKILLADSVTSDMKRLRKTFTYLLTYMAQTHHCTKFYQNCSFRCRDIAIF